MPRKNADHIFPPLPKGFNSPFYYSALYSFFLYYQVDGARVEPHLKGTGLKAALMDGKALVNIDFQRYLSSGNNYLEQTVEIEFNIVSYPASREPDVPTMALKDFLAGQEQTKTIGNYRLHVACDDKIAVQAGRELYGEAKFYTTFTYTVPDLNFPETTTWQFTCQDPVNKKQAIFSVDADISMLPAQTSNMSPVVDFSMLKVGKELRLDQSWRNLLGAFQTFYTDPRSTVSLEYGQSKNRMREDMQKIIGSSPCVAIQLFQSVPVCIEGRGFFVNPR
ncbi:MAG TPA: hypothetical protein VJO34_12340 [Methylomirabilota bacterium]|nr:hypothetical protein [Methylomirabilota bacterium]